MIYVINGVKIFEDPTHVGTREIVRMPSGTYVHSIGCLLQILIARVRWHDEPRGCPTWTGAEPELGGRCCCDVEFAGDDLMGGGFKTRIAL